MNIVRTCMTFYCLCTAIYITSTCNQYRSFVVGICRIIKKTYHSDDSVFALDCDKTSINNAVDTSEAIPIDTKIPIKIQPYKLPVRQKILSESEHVVLYKHPVVIL